ncbi:MAG: o-succinylbenzoate synthase [Gemmatimonadota bacterium]
MSSPVLVARIVLREIRLRLREPFLISSGSVLERRVLLLELQAAGGVVGWSECVAQERPNYSPETVDTAWWAIREWLAPRVLGREFDSPEEVALVLEEGVRGHRMAKAAVEMGAWELAARIRKEPLARLLGGSRERVETGISLGLQESPEVLARKVREAREVGYRRIKLKIKPGADLAFVAAAREALAPDAPLMADANAAYGPADFDRLAALDEFGLLMLEQPLDGEDLRGHAELQSRLETPLCLDESITSPKRTEEMIALHAGRIVNIKPGRVGGFAASRKIHDLCARHHLPVWCGGMLESGVGRAHNVALASLPNFTLPGDLSASRRYWEQDIVEPEWTVEEDSTVKVPLDRPGMGVEVDRERVDALSVRTEELAMD